MTSCFQVAISQCVYTAYYEAVGDPSEKPKEAMKKRRNQPRIDYSRIHRADPTPQEGLDDISELLDDEEDESPAPSNAPSQLQQALAEAKRQRKAEAFAWYDEDDDDEI